MITDKHFRDWHSYLFGYGYGTGEEYTCAALKAFFECFKDARHYEHDVVEAAMGAIPAWLMINALHNCKPDILDYGTSPRYAWLTPQGELLYEYIMGHSVDELTRTAWTVQEDGMSSECSPGNCVCDDPCNNPLFKR